jgi:hypothetical protein
MSARAWAGLIVISLLGILAMAWLAPMVAALPPWVPSNVFTTFARIRSGGNPTAPSVLPHSAAVNVFIVGSLVTLACIFLSFWWITRPLVIRFTPPRQGDQ